MENIKIINKAICENIKRITAEDRGIFSQNILSQLRNFVESIAVAILINKGQKLSSRNYLDIQEGLKNIQSQGKYKNLQKFHDLLQKSTSHYTVDPESSERLMLKYYEYLLKLKIFVKKELNIDILENLLEFPINQDPQLHEYYEKISWKIDRFVGDKQFTDRYYIYKTKPFFINQKIYYEVSFIIATNNTSKFERIIAFTSLDIMTNYSVRLSLHKSKIDVLGRQMEIFIINDWDISIRPCEIENFSKIFSKKITGTSKEDRALMFWLKSERLNLVDLVNSNDHYYQYIKNYVTENKPSIQFFSVLDQCRQLIKNNLNGKNIIQYLLYSMNNNIIKAQYSNTTCKNLTNLSLQWGCIPFDQMPFATSPIGHNPRFNDLLECFNITNREHELFAKKISQNNEVERLLFSDIKNLEQFEDISKLITTFNANLYQGTEAQKLRKLCIYNNHVYIDEYIKSCIKIVQNIQNLTQNGVTNYANSMVNWQDNLPVQIDCAEKKDILKKLFTSSQVALIYGSAGTGKSTLIGYLAKYFNDQNKLFLTNTNTAKSNLERRIDTENCTYRTVASFIKKPSECDILFIDEASTISNRDMKRILDLAQFKLLILVGDNYQIESIRFGNWFDIIKYFIPKNSVHELTTPYRASHQTLLDLWNKVRKIDDSILESLVVRETNPYSKNLDETIFDSSTTDQIILCLNYDGLYGINNINRLLQEANPNKSISLGMNKYKIGDPILFNDSERFHPIIYNNLKGEIINFYKENHLIWFEIKIDSIIDETAFWSVPELQLIDIASDNKAIVKFSVEETINTDEDDLFSKKTMPFQIAYAISIHKAQGLEYDSVKVVINNEVDEKITHNIFYTAITRAKNQLTIYWSPESERKILGSFKLNDYGKDVHFIKQFLSET
jgi:hypothetical protein